MGLDLLVHPLEQVGAPELVPLAEREVAECQHVLPGRSHEFCRPWELGGEHVDNLEPQQLTAAIGIDAHGDDDGA